MLRPLPAIAASLLLAACERGFLPLGGVFDVGRDPMVIFVAGDSPAGGDLYALQADGGAAIPITFSVVGEMRPSLSPGGGQVAFLRGGTLTDSLPASVWVLNLGNGAERQVRLPVRAGRPERVGWIDEETLVVGASGGVYGAPSPPNLAEARPLRGPARAAAESALAVLVGNPAFARVVPCDDPADLCVVGDSGGAAAPLAAAPLAAAPLAAAPLAAAPLAAAPLAEAASDPARWGDDSVAYLTGGRLVVRPVGPGRPRFVQWSGVPPRPRQLTVFAGASARR